MIERSFGFAIATILTLVTARGAMGAGCPGDVDLDGRVSISELVSAVNSALRGCPPPGLRFLDNGDGTITDTRTGLMWEAKSDDGGIHDRDDLYTWSTSDAAPDGTVFGAFLATLNEERFAGYADWRLPTVDELLGIVAYDRFDPATDRAFDDGCEPGCSLGECSCTPPAISWSSTTNAANTGFAWGVSFVLGGVSLDSKTDANHVRAVRGGS